MIAFGSNEISKVCLGSNELSKVCLGSTELWSGQLPYDAEIEYLESTGTQWIDLGFRATDNIYIDIDIYRANNNIRFDCGAEEGWSTKIIRLIIQEGNQAALRYGNTSTSSNTITSSSNCVGDIRIECDKKVAKIYNLTSGVNYSKTVTGNTPILTPGNFILFGCTVGSEASVAAASSGCRLYSAKVIDTGVNLDLIPVRVGETGYLYDKISGRLFGNSGTGSFTLGSDKSGLPYDAEVEYLESTGTQYINTGILPNTNLSYSLRIKRTSSSSTDQIPFGSRNSNYYGFVVWTNTSSGKGYAFHYCYGSGKDQREDSGWVYTGNIIDSFHTIDVNNQSISVDGVIRYTWTQHASTLVTSTIPLYLFALRDNQSIDSRIFVGRIAFAKIYLSDVLVRDFIPVRVRQIGYMYDRVSGELFGNIGSGSFTLGQDKT